MASKFKLQHLPSLSMQVTQFSHEPIFSTFNFISTSRTQFRVSLPFNRLHCLSLSSSPSPSPSPSPFFISEKSLNEHSFVVSYLINTFGWPSKIAILKAKHLKFNTPENPEKVLNFFKKHGFTDTQISLLVKKYPKLLLVNPENTLFPMFEFLSSLGFSSTEIIDFVTKAPQILEMSLEKIVVPTFNLLCNLVNSNDEAVKMVKQYPSILTHYPEVDNIQSLLEAGVPPANIVAFMSYPQYTPTPDNLRKMVKEVKEMGFDLHTMKLLLELRTIKLLSKSTWEDKLRVLKKYGWSDREILLALEKHPKFIMVSNEKIEGIMDFLVNTMGIEATAAAKFPYIFLKSFEKRIFPRCLVYLFMLEKGLCERTFSIYTFCSFSETQFLTRFIKPYENEAPELWNLYKSLTKLNSLRLSSAPSPLSVSESNAHSFVISYLMNTFGLLPKDAISQAKYLRFKTHEKPEKVVTFLKKYGFTKTQISRIVKKRPRLLLANPETNFLPKLEFLSSLGLSRTEVTDVVTKGTDILKLSLEKIVIPSFSLIRNLVNSDDEAVKIVKRYPTILTQCPEVDNIKILLEEGVSVPNILVFMSYQQKGFTPTSPDRFRKTVEKVKEMGFDPCTMKFLFAIWAIKSLGKSTWEDKAQIFKKYGWSDREFLLAFEKYPSFIGSSKDKIDRVMDFLVNTVGIEAIEVASYPYIISLSFEKRIVPRGLVYKSVLEKGLCERKLGIYTVLSYYSEDQFLAKFIEPYENEAPELWDLYKNPFASFFKH